MIQFSYTDFNMILKLIRFRSIRVIFALQRFHVCASILQFAHHDFFLHLDAAMASSLAACFWPLPPPSPLHIWCFIALDPWNDAIVPFPFTFVGDCFKSVNEEVGNGLPPDAIQIFQDWLFKSQKCLVNVCIGSTHRHVGLPWHIGQCGIDSVATFGSPSCMAGGAPVVVSFFLPLNLFPTEPFLPNPIVQMIDCYVQQQVSEQRWVW